MLKTIIFGPGRLLCGQPVAQKHSSHPRLAAYRSQGPVIALSLICWALVVAGILFGLKMLSNVDPPPPPLPPLDRSTAVAQAEAGAGIIQAPISGAAGSGLAAATNSPAPEAGQGHALETAPPPTQAWLVIVESIPKSARSEAERALAKHKKKGVRLELLDTDAYPKLKSGLWALAQGPFDTKSEAEAAAVTLKPQVKGLMVRRGL
ncbi:MAG: SPOR domain-containing protein [Deltaproteobacteria bacterium]|jgi:hypothetical protein|nr:SPOR domain-containing protein [Deltaproteobacteria bacterium]